MIFSLGFAMSSRLHLSPSLPLPTIESAGSFFFLPLNAQKTFSFFFKVEYFTKIHLGVGCPR